MLDFVLGAALAGLVVRGWIRGFIREIVDLVSLILGIWVAFTLSEPLGNYLSDQFEVSAEVARVGSGILLFVLFGVAMGIGAHFLSQAMRIPGLNLLNRIGGSFVAGLWGIALILVVVNFAGVLPVPDGLSNQIDESTVVEAIAGDDAIPQRVFEGLGDRGILSSLSSLQTLFGENRVVPHGDEALLIPPAAEDELRQVRDEVGLIVDRVNESRLASAAGALLIADPITAVAERRATAMYSSGRVSRDTPPGGSVTDDLLAAGIRLEVDGEVLALASTSRAALDAVLEDDEARSLLLSTEFDRVGVSVVEGPTGVLLVLVLGG